MNKASFKYIGEIDGEKISTDMLNIKSSFKLEELDSLGKLFLLVCLAGYKKKENILVYGEDISELIDLVKFGNLNLNFERAAPKKFDLSIKFEGGRKKFENIELNNDKKILVLLSGGIDSVAGLLYSKDNFSNVSSFWLNFGQKNSSGELKSIEKIIKKTNCHFEHIDIGLKNYVDSGWNEWKFGIVPARNMLILSMLGQYISRLKEKNIDIFLCASKDEIVESHNDTSPAFYKTASKLMSLFYGKNINVTTPFKNINKAEILKYWKDNWKDKYSISFMDTMTCFLGSNCGECSACVYRKINSLVIDDEDMNFVKNPMYDASRIIRDYYLPNFSGWSHERKADFLIALGKSKKIIPTEVLYFYNKNYSLYSEEIKKREKSLENVNL
jgi:7-cyano-7-deazaguanine synthase in queuosine biosynthesis